MPPLPDHSMEQQSSIRALLDQYINHQSNQPETSFPIEPLQASLVQIEFRRLCVTETPSHEDIDIWCNLIQYPCIVAMAKQAVPEIFYGR